jgi:hypothetical protein
MQKETEYRTFEELIDTVSIDLKGIDWENIVEPIELIGVAERINAEFGLKISPKVDRCLMIENGRAKLPVGFHAMNTAWLLQDELEKRGINSSQKTYIEELIDNLQTAQALVNEVYSGVRKTEIQTVISHLPKGLSIIKHKLNTDNIIVQAITDADEILVFDFTAPNNCDIVINNQSNRAFLNVKFTVAGGTNFSEVNAFNAVVEDQKVTVTSKTSETVYGNPEQIEFVSAKFHGAPKETMPVFNRPIAYIKKGWVYLPGVVNGLLRISYSSKMENEDGEYLVLLHPLVNDYYDYSIKERIFENLIMAGHSEFGQRHQLMAMKAEQNKMRANGYVSTPDFGEMRRTHRFNRARAYNKYYKNQR